MIEALLFIVFILACGMPGKKPGSTCPLEDFILWCRGR